MDAPFNPGDELEKLFLIEILIENLKLEKSKLDLGEEDLDKSGLCVTFKFLNHPPLSICEGDFCSETKERDPSLKEIAFKSGKSSLFSLRYCSPEIKKFNIGVFVEIKKEPREIFGKSCLELGQRFLDILNCKSSDCASGAITHCTREKLLLSNDKKESVGSINVFVRFTCFGNMIVTQFQVASEEREAFFFKGAEKKVNPGGEPCDPAATKRIPCSDKDNQERPRMVLPPFGGVEGQHPQYGQFPPGFPPQQYQQPYFQPGRPMQPQYPNVYNPLPFSGGLLGGSEGGAAMYPPSAMPQYHQPGGKVPFCGKLHFGGGSSSSSSSEDEEEQPQPPPQPVLPNFCSCDYPLPPGFGLPPPPPKKPKKKKKKKPRCPYDLAGRFCMRGNCPVGLPQFPTEKKKSPGFEAGTLALMPDRVVLHTGSPQQPHFQQPYPQQPQGQQAWSQQPMWPQQTTPRQDWPQYPGYYPQGGDPADRYSLRLARDNAAPATAGAPSPFGQATRVEVQFEQPATGAVKRRVCSHHAETQYFVSDFGGVPEGQDKDKNEKGKKGGKKGKGGKGGKGKKKK